ncbi:MAG TPA: YbaB/EbfC family nucleoid-associated protein [Actinomycetes bacterium]|nr:YbaB/EbfC family nucleoid-associated protein [Actinomycetes bacterium]
MPDISSLLAQAQQMQQQIAASQAELADQRVHGDSGGGLVNATVTGSGELVGLSISPDALDPDDTETLSDLVLAAYRDATAKATQLQESQMSQVTAGLGDLGLPGL